MINYLKDEMPPFPGEILIPGSAWAACPTALSWTLGLSSFINSKSILTYLRNNRYGDLLSDFPGKGVAGKGENPNRGLGGNMRDLGG